MKTIPELSQIRGVSQKGRGRHPTNRRGAERAYLDANQKTVLINIRDKLRYT